MRDSPCNDESAVFFTAFFNKLANLSELSESDVLDAIKLIEQDPKNPYLLAISNEKAIKYRSNLFKLIEKNKKSNLNLISLFFQLCLMLAKACPIKVYDDNDVLIDSISLDRLEEDHITFSSGHQFNLMTVYQLNVLTNLRRHPVYNHPLSELERSAIKLILIPKISSRLSQRGNFSTKDFYALHIDLQKALLLHINDLNQTDINNIVALGKSKDKSKYANKLLTCLIHHLADRSLDEGIKKILISDVNILISSIDNTKEDIPIEYNTYFTNHINELKTLTPESISVPQHQAKTKYFSGIIQEISGKICDERKGIEFRFFSYKEKRRQVITYLNDGINALIHCDFTLLKNSIYYKKVSQTKNTCNCFAYNPDVYDIEAKIKAYTEKYKNKLALSNGASPLSRNNN